MFHAFGVAVYDADHWAKLLMNEEVTLVEAIKNLLGSEAYSADGMLDRRYISSRVFEERSLLECLNSIVHPAVAGHFKRWAVEQVSPYVILESAILFESGFDKMMDRTVVITAAEDIRVQRVMKRDGLTEQQVRARIANQMNDDRREALADYIIHSDYDTSPQEVERLHQIFLLDAGR